MSAQPKENTAPDLVEIEIDGKPLRAPKGAMIIQAADAAGIPVPRFCYHKKLAVAANCRQCMVEVEMGGKRVPKPQVACATPVAPGMKVFTRSPNAVKWQRNTMEFLLINHPLDCPICDQGGECELQDISLGYGRSVSRFTERKRSVADEDVGQANQDEVPADHPPVDCPGRRPGGGGGAEDYFGGFGASGPALPGRQPGGAGGGGGGVVGRGGEALNPCPGGLGFRGEGRG